MREVKKEQVAAWTHLLFMALQCLGGMKVYPSLQEHPLVGVQIWSHSPHSEHGPLLTGGALVVSLRLNGGVITSGEGGGDGGDTDDGEFVVVDVDDEAL